MRFDARNPFVSSVLQSPRRKLVGQNEERVAEFNLQVAELFRLKLKLVL